MIISDGYNGTPSGFENVCEEDADHTKPYVLHAEANAITKVARSNNSSDGATLYITTSPCMECSKLIIQAGIRRVVFGEYYRMHDGVDLLCRAGIEIVHLWQHGDQCEPVAITSDNSESHYQEVAKELEVAR
jgi:dCMP deaminase